MIYLYIVFHDSFLNWLINFDLIVCNVHMKIFVFYMHNISFIFIIAISSFGALYWISHYKCIGSHKYEMEKDNINNLWPCWSSCYDVFTPLYISWTHLTHQLNTSIILKQILIFAQRRIQYHYCNYTLSDKAP